MFNINKKIILSIALIFSVIFSLCQEQHLAEIVPAGGGTFAQLDAAYLRGGWREVTRITERDSITYDRQRVGMVVYVAATDSCYKLFSKAFNLNASNWYAFKLGSADFAAIQADINRRWDSIYIKNNYYNKTYIDNTFSTYVPVTSSIYQSISVSNGGGSSFINMYGGSNAYMRYGSTYGNNFSFFQTVATGSNSPNATIWVGDQSSNNTTTILTASPLGVKIDARWAGHNALYYANNYAANYSNRSVPDVNYVDSARNKSRDSLQTNLTAEVTRATAAEAAKVSTSTTITINGTTLDLSANRTFTVSAGFTPNSDTTVTANYTCTARDAGRNIFVNSSSSVTISMPQDSDASIAYSLPQNQKTITIWQQGTGAVVVAAGTGATVNVMDGASTIIGRYGVATLVKQAANSWYGAGALK
ncbi:MAG: hypothetical protein JSR11_03555 [Bacteroidetes bacterium]|nr:hypothetical protein [Bacteroidota bacterium]